MTPIKISWSSLRNHVECKQRTKLLREKKRHKSTNSRNYLGGNITDRVVRNFIQGKNYEPGLMAQMVEEQVDASVKESNDQGGYVKWRNAADRSQLIAECREAVTKIEPALFEHVTPYEPIADFQFEAPMFAARHDGGEPIPVLLNGFMDLLVYRPDTDDRTIYDVKHTRDSQYWKKTRGQLTFYTVVTDLLFGKPATSAALLQPLVEGTPVKEVPIDDDEQLILLQAVTGMANDVINGDFPLVDEVKTCYYCDVKHACPRFAGEKTATGRRRVSFGPSISTR